MSYGRKQVIWMVRVYLLGFAMLTPTYRAETESEFQVGVSL